MSFRPFSSVTSRTIVLSQVNIDTDQIIPARFLTTTTKEGLGKFAFYDWRYNEAGDLMPANPLDCVGAEDHQVLVAGSNFGCGSSREHAPWALTDFGFRVVISSDVADIYKSNSLKNGLLPVEVAAEIHHWLLDNPGSEVTVDLEEQTLLLPDQRIVKFDIDQFARQCLLDGVDQLGHLLNQLPEIEQFEAR